MQLNYYFDIAGKFNKILLTQNTEGNKVQMFNVIYFHITCFYILAGLRKCLY